MEVTSLLRWCSYCQEFQGEVQPFQEVAITHGICPECKAKGLHMLEGGLARSLLLKQTQNKLMEIGQARDVEEAGRIIDLAVGSGLRYVDILIGLIVPLLSNLGEDWERGLVTVLEAHQFAVFCEQVCTLVSEKMRVQMPADHPGRGPAVLLLNAYGNDHRLALRILWMWLESRSIHSRLLDPSPPPEELAAIVSEMLPPAVLISLALAEQRPGVLELMESLRQNPECLPAVYIGGYAIKMNLVDPIPGATFVVNIADLERLLHSAIA